MKQPLRRLTSWLERHQTLALGFGVLLAFVVRFIKLGSWSIWFDESFTSSLIRQDYSTAVAITAKDVHPPLYYLVLKTWTLLFGSSDVALRSFSVLLSVLAAYLLYCLIKQRFNPKIALAAFYLVALGPFGVRYAQEARMYALVTVFVVIATGAFLRLMEDKKPSRVVALTYSLAVAAALYSHYFVFPLVIAHVIYAYIYHHHGLLPRPSSIRRFVNEKRLWLYALLVSSGLYLPWVPTAIHQFSNVANGFWIPKVTIMAPFNTLFFFMTNTSTDRISFAHGSAWANLMMAALAVYLAVLTIVGVAAWRMMQSAVQKRTVVLLMLTSLVPMFVILSLSVGPFQSLYIDRYFVYFSALWYALIGIILAARWPGSLAWLRRPMVVVTLIWFALGLSYVYRLGNFNYNTWQQYGSKQLMSEVNRDYHPGDIILTNDIFTFYDALHYNHTPTQVLADTTKTGTSDTPYLRQFPELLVSDTSGLRAERVWYLTLADDQPHVPANWHLVGNPTIAQHAKLSLYEVR